MLSARMAPFLGPLNSRPVTKLAAARTWRMGPKSCFEDVLQTRILVRKPFKKLDDTEGFRLGNHFSDPS